MTQQQAKEFVAHRHKLGREFVEAGRRQGAWAGIERLVTEELYPDQTHFLFELLQNAEDARATELHFALSHDRLSSWHDGKRLFSHEDVEGITSIGQSQKREDVNQIGKFGVGFKSVFAYTLSPRISSGVFHFEITDLVCPEWVEPQERLNPRFTYVHFPFNRPSKVARTCFKEIAAGLDRLPHSTLLFLRNIEQVTWKVAGKDDGFIKKDLLESGIIRIRQRDSSGNSKTTHWLKFEAPLKETPELVCSIAFMLRPPPKKDADTDSELLPDGKVQPRRFVIAPLSEPGHLNIFFPAGKEPTGLYFLVHAPFAATVDRASIPFEHEGNRQLIEEIAALCASKLHEIKELGLLLPQFLGVLPNEKDELDDFYSPIREAIVNEFKENSLLPTHYGGYARAKDAVYGPRELRHFFDDEDLSFLMGDRNKVWSPGFRSSSRPDFFLDTLEILEVDWKAFVGYIGNKLHRDNVSVQQLSASHQWLKRKMANASNPVEWLRSFYLVLLRADKEIRPHQWYPPDPDLRRAAVVWTDSDSFHAGDAVFFETGSVSLPGVTISTVHFEILAFEQKQTEKAKEMRTALSMLGVKEYDEQKAIEALVAKISTQKLISRNDHLAQMRCLLEWFRASKIEDFAVFKNAPLFLDADESAHRQSSAFYIDAPFRETGLKVFFTGVQSRYALWPGYIEHFDQEVVAAFAENTGVLADIPIRKIVTASKHPDSAVLLRYFGKRRTDNEIDQDWVIDRLDALLALGDPTINRVLWDGMGKAHPRVLQACYQPNGQYPLQTAPSSLVYALRDAEWILGKDGLLHSPKDLTEDTLEEGWPMNGSNGWLTAVAFGASAANCGIEQSLRAEAAKQLGITPELVEELHSLSPLEQQEILTRIRESKAPPPQSFPSDTGPTSETRAVRAEEKARQAPTIARETRQRTLRTSTDKSEVRIYLAEKYDLDGQLYCQMSHEPMPFSLPSGGPFFEAVEFLSMEKENAANYLCLSPICAAEFKYALQTDDATLRDRIYSLDASLPEKQLSIQIEVPLLQHRIVRFTRSHLIDLQAALKILSATANSVQSIDPINPATKSSDIVSAAPSPLKNMNTSARWCNHPTKTIQVPEPVSVAELALLLEIKPFQIIKHLMTFHLFVSINETVPRAYVGKLASHFGFSVRFDRPQSCS